MPSADAGSRPAHRTVLERQDVIAREADVAIGLAACVAALFIAALTLAVLIVARAGDEAVAPRDTFGEVGAPGYAAAILMGSITFVVLFIQAYRAGPSAARVRRAALPGPDDDGMADTLARMAVAAGIQPPRLVVVESDVVNACALGTSAHGTVVVTTGARWLPARERDALAAHCVSALASHPVARVRAARQAGRRTLQLAVVSAVAASSLAFAAGALGRPRVGALVMGIEGLASMVSIPVLLALAALVTRTSADAEILADVGGLRLLQYPEAFVALCLRLAEDPRWIRSGIDPGLWFERAVLLPTTLGAMAAERSQTSLLVRADLALAAASGADRRLGRRLEELLRVEQLRADRSYRSRKARATSIVLWGCFLGGTGLVFLGAGADSGTATAIGVVLLMIAAALRLVRIDTDREDREIAEGAMFELERLTGRCGRCEGGTFVVGSVYRAGTVASYRCGRCGGTGRPPSRSGEIVDDG